jgi:hypothetical protein
MLWGSLAQMALAAILEPGRDTPGLFHQLAVRAAGLVAAMVLGILAVVCAAAGALILWAPPLDAPHILFILSAALLFLALVTWLAIAKGRGPHQLVSEVLDTPASPLKELNRKVERVTDAFSRGWHSY